MFFVSPTLTMMDLCITQTMYWTPLLLTEGTQLDISQLTAGIRPKPLHWLSHVVIDKNYLCCYYSSNIEEPWAHPCYSLCLLHVFCWAHKINKFWHTFIAWVYVVGFAWFKTPKWIHSSDRSLHIKTGPRSMETFHPIPPKYFSDYAPDSSDKSWVITLIWPLKGSRNRLVFV